MTARRAVAALLEWEWPWPAWRGIPGLTSPVRRLALPAGLAVVGVGGATLGGSGKTPVAIALAAALARRGHRVVFVAHGYRASPPSPALRVAPSAEVAAVGDEALLAARALEGLAPVVVGRSRAGALSAASELGGVAVVDGLLQTSPVRLACSLLALDGARPWGSGRVLPLGDLRASPARLQAGTDEVVRVGGVDCPTAFSLSAPPRVGARVALLSSMARPSRFAEAAGALGLVPVFHVKRGDHEPLGRREREVLRTLAARHRLDGWCVDAKTSVLLTTPSERPDVGAPLSVLRQELTPSPALVDRVVRALAAWRETLTRP